MAHDLDDPWDASWNDLSKAARAYFTYEGKSTAPLVKLYREFLAHNERIREKTRAEVVDLMAGEWGELEVGPTESLDDAVSHIRDAGKVFIHYVTRLQTAEDQLKRVRADFDAAMWGHAMDGQGCWPVVEERLRKLFPAHAERLIAERNAANGD